MNILTAHIGHRLIARDEKHLRCVDCSHTLVMPAPSAAGGSTSSTAPRTHEKCPTHPAGWLGLCSGCAADAKAVADGAPTRQHEPAGNASAGAAAARAVLAAYRARKAQ